VTLLDLLFGKSSFDLINFSMPYIGLLFNGLFGLSLLYIPVRQNLRVRPLAAILINIGEMALCGAVVYAFPAIFSGTIGSQFIGVAMWSLLGLPTCFLLLKNCMRRIIAGLPYFLSVCVFVIGGCNWLEFWCGRLFAPGTAAIATALARLALLPIVLIVGVRSITKLYSAWDSSKTDSFWKTMWLIPAALLILSLLSGNYMNLTEANSTIFLLTRILNFIVLLACIDLITGIIRREHEAAAERMRERNMDEAGRALDKTYAETLASLENANAARREAKTATESVIAALRAGARDEIPGLLRGRIDSLGAGTGERFCDNEAVNALVSHFEAAARDGGIEFSCKLNIPGQAGRVQNVDLSRIAWNMLENAAEACRRMDYGAKFIRFNSMVINDMLVLVTDNSFDGEFTARPDGGYVSRKRESGVATGLSSIRAVAEKYGGAAGFDAKDRVFKTSVRLDMAGGGIV
jgi:hypothetical protein